MDENQGFERREEEKQNVEMLNLTSNQIEVSKLCPICDKEFPCGKALGGHMRVHATHDSSSHNNSNGDESPTCTVCEKVFPSWRSLYGHMRCHPSRQWKGILTPSKEEEGVRSDSMESNHDPILVRTRQRVSFTMRWGVTGKRGRKGTFVDAELEVCEAAQNLMWLANGSCSWGRGRYSISSYDFTVKSNMNSKNQIDFDDESELKSTGGSNGEDGFQVSLKQGKRKKMKSKLKLKLIEEKEDLVIIKGSQVDSNIGPSQSVFQCVTCKKEFSSYQALGGHRSKHYKERNAEWGVQNGLTREDTQSSNGPKPMA